MLRVAALLSSRVRPAVREERRPLPSMTSTHRTAKRRLRPLTALVVLSCTVATGCGDTKLRANVDRPPQVLTLTAFISGGEVQVSPTHFGAGPVNLTVTNQTRRSQQVTIETGGNASGVRQTTG